MNTALSNKNRRGFALIATMTVMVLLVMVAMGVMSLSKSQVKRSSNQELRLEAEANARMAMVMALGELQKALGPDQRVTAVADILSEASSKAPQLGRSRWLGVWDTNEHNPRQPAQRDFVTWLVSSNSQSSLGSESAARQHALADELKIFRGLNAEDSVVVDKIPVEGGAYAYWVEDEGVKADLEWNEGDFDEEQRGQAARLAASPGVDHGVFGGPFAGKISYPIASGSDTWVENLEKAGATADMTLAVGGNGHQRQWLKEFRHDITYASRGVLANNTAGGLRQDLSLAFEMDGEAESESATLFNQQVGDFVGGTDTQASPYPMPGMGSLKARYLFRDFPSAGNPFSSDITEPKTVVRGPSWWLLRDYANLYKRLKKSGDGYALQARAYYPNRSVTQDLMDVHASNQFFSAGYKVTPVNREPEPVGGIRAYKPARANYAPVLLGVNAIYSLKFEGGRLKMFVDPFFIIWNPYNSAITAPKFAVTLENGLAGGMRFRHVDGNGDSRYYGKASGHGSGKGSDTSFVDFAKRKSGVNNGHVSYLLTDLSLGPGEIMIYSPPSTSDRSSSANVLNDELALGINYDAEDSGIEFDEFPEYAWELQPKKDPDDPNEEDKSAWISKGWKPVSINAAVDGPHRIEALFNIASQQSYAIVNIIETSLPSSSVLPNQLTNENQFGEQINGQEYRLNWGGTSIKANLETGVHWGGSQNKEGTITNERWPISYPLTDLVGQKESFGMLSMLTIPSDYDEAGTKMEVFSQLNATPIVRSQNELFGHGPLNVVVKAISGYGVNTLMQKMGIDLDIFNNGNNGYYGKSYSSFEGDIRFPLTDIPDSPLHSLVQFSGANIGTRLFEPTHAIGNSWRPPYVREDSVYYNANNYFHNSSVVYTFNDVSWQSNQALFDDYFLSGIAPGFSIGVGGYRSTGSIEQTLEEFYSSDPAEANASPAMAPHIPSSKTAAGVVADLAESDGYKKMAAYSVVKGAFNVNSTSVEAWTAFLSGNKNLALEQVGGAKDGGKGTPFPLASTVSDTNSKNGWEKFSRLSDADIERLAEKIVEQVKQRGPFMNLADLINRRVGSGDDANLGAIQEAIEQAGVNADTSSGIGAAASAFVPNYEQFYIFDNQYAKSLGNRTNATGVPLEVNQANILLPIAPKLSARSDSFTIRAYGEAVSAKGKVYKAVCEARVQRLPEFVDPANEPWAELDELSELNQQLGRRMQVLSFRWLAPDEI